MVTIKTCEGFQKYVWRGNALMPLRDLLQLHRLQRKYGLPLPTFEEMPWIDRMVALRNAPTERQRDFAAGSAAE